jgi:hypothetical protein
MKTAALLLAVVLTFIAGARAADEPQLAEA